MVFFLSRSRLNNAIRKKNSRLDRRLSTEPPKNQKPKPSTKILSGQSHHNYLLNGEHLMPLFKVLYIDSGVNCIAGSALLEQATSQLFLSCHLVCVFTVVNNPFIGIECTEHTCYDAIVIQKNLPHQTIDSLDFVRVLRNVGALTPMILLYERNDVGIAEISNSFCCKLQKPFSANSLCEAILSARNSLAQSFQENASEYLYQESLLTETGVIYDTGRESSAFDYRATVSPQASTTLFNNVTSPYQDILMETLASLVDDD